MRVNWTQMRGRTSGRHNKDEEKVVDTVVNKFTGTGVAKVEYKGKQDTEKVMDCIRGLLE
jgi:hypothetical protein